MSRLPSFFDLAGGQAASSSGAGFGGGNVTENLYSNEIDRQDSLASQGRVSQPGMDRIQGVQDNLLGQFKDFGSTLTSQEDLSNYANQLSQSGRGAIASRGLSGSNLGDAFGRQVESARGELSEILRGMTALPEPTPTPTPAPTPTPTPTPTPPPTNVSPYPDGQTRTINGVTYRFSRSTGTWSRLPG